MQNENPHILIIDDDHIFCMMLEDILTRAGYQVTYVFNGEEGIKILKENPERFDAVLLDRVMPELSGLDVLYKLCMIPVVREIPVIMITSHAENSHVSTAVTYGVYDTVFKPVEDVLLFSVLKRALEEKGKKVPHQS